MPLSRAVKMGASGLKTKPIRLFFTILLSVVSFTLFGVLSAMMLYDPFFPYLMPCSSLHIYQRNSSKICDRNAYEHIL